MRELVYHVATSLDHFICDANGSVAAFPADGDHVTDYLAHLQTYDTVVMGRHTYEFGYQFGLQPGQLAYPHMRHYVVSKTLELPEGSQVHVVRHNAVDFIKGLKQEEGTPIYLCGGGKLACTLLQNQLIDRLLMKVNPILLGAGTPLFDGVPPLTSLKLLATKSYQSGVVLLTYQVNRATT